MANNKQLPDWKNAPEWAMYRAVDKSGKIFYYSNEPQCGRNGWIFKNGFLDLAGYADATDWQNSLECRPENTAPTPDELTQMCGPNYELWEYLHNELGVIALDSQLGDIIEIVRLIEQKRKEQQ